ncbi:MAG: hypothetical protein ABSE63_17875 [Thermoguttaceae bacterium]|jgi:hypothetical protein
MVLTFVFAILNICLGFALAMYLGNGLSGSHEAVKESGMSRVEARPKPAAAPSHVSPSPAAKTIVNAAPDYQQEPADADNEIFADEMNLDSMCNELS